MLCISDKVCFNFEMEKQKAIELLGGTVTAAAEAIGITYQAVVDWPDVLSDRIADRVQAALYRQSAQHQDTQKAA